MSCKIGVLWDSEVDHEGGEPFDDSNVNHTYQVFSEIAAEKGAEVYIANYNSYDHEKLAEAYFYDNGWKKVEKVDIDVVFDKYKFDRETQQIKRRIQVELPVLNRFELDELCKDKLLSYEKFSEIVPETCEATRRNVEEMLETGKVILKPRFDYGGHGIKVIETLEEFQSSKNQLAQRFVDSESGIEELGIEGVHDLRVLVLNGEPVGAYVRTPKEGYISNVSMGGSMEFVELDDVPEKAMEIVETVSDNFDRFNPSYYSVDMIFDLEGNAWVLEFNSKPGLNFYQDDEIEKWKRPIMQKVVETLVEMC